MAANRDSERPPRFELGPIRPPNEGSDRSLLIRATRHCPWNRCHFCNTYKGLRFQYRSAAEVSGDIDIAAAIAERLQAASWRLGSGGRIDEAVFRAAIETNPDYASDAVPYDELALRFQCLSNVGNWLNAGAATVFLQDADSLIMRTPDSLAVLAHLRAVFPSVQRVTSYARSHTARRKPPDDLRRLHEAGIARVHVGLESGCDAVLAMMDKGVTAAGQVEAGLKLKTAGISVSEYVMPGLGGRRLSERHALDTAAVLNAIEPDYIRLRTLVVRPDTPLYERAARGEFDAASEDEVVAEIRLLVESVRCRSYLVSDQMSNLLWEVEGQLPDDKPAILETIDAYRRLDAAARLRLRLERRLRSFVGVYGSLTPELAAQVETARQRLADDGDAAAPTVEAAIAGLKRGFV